MTSNTEPLPSGSRVLTARNAAVVRLVILALLFTNGILVSRGLGPVGRGSVQLLVTIASLLVVAGGLSGELGCSRLLIARPATRRHLGSTSLVAPLVLGLVVVVTAGLVLNILGLPGRVVQSDTAVWVALLPIPFMIASAWTQRALLIDGRFNTACVGPTINAAILLCGSTIWLLADNMTVLRVLSCFLAGALLEYCFYALVLNSQLRAFSIRIALDVIRAGARFYPSQLGLTLMMRVDVLLLASFRGAAETGLYAVALSISGPLGVLASTVSNTFMSRQYSDDRARAVGSTQRLIRSLAIMVGIAALLIGAVSIVAIPVLWGPAFSGAIAPTLLLLAGAVPIAVQRPIGQFLVREGLVRATTTRTFAGLGVAVLACALLVPSLGAIGAALGADLAALTYAVLSLIFYRRAVGCTWRALLARPLSLIVEDGTTLEKQCDAKA